MKKENILILGGNSKNNISWIKEVNETFKNDYEVMDVYYDHWKNDSEIDFDIELKKLEKMLCNTNDYYIVAKSIGSIISLMGIEKNIIKPKGIIILGFPITFLKEQNFNYEPLIESAIKETKILIIQQQNDPLGKYSEVRNELQNIIKVVEVPGDDHSYNDIKSIKQLTDEFIKSI